MQCEKQRLLGRRWNFAIIVLERRGILQGLEPYRLELAWPRKEFSPELIMDKSNRHGSNTTYITKSVEIVGADSNETEDDGADKGEGGESRDGGEGGYGFHLEVSHNTT